MHQRPKAKSEGIELNDNLTDNEQTRNIREKKGARREKKKNYAKAYTQNNSGMPAEETQLVVRRTKKPYLH